MRYRLLDYVAFVLLPRACGSERCPSQARITGGYVLTHEHPMNALAFGGNYAFTGAPGKF
jgi:hypothetical protein